MRLKIPGGHRRIVPTNENSSVGVRNVAGEKAEKGDGYIFDGAIGKTTVVSSFKPRPQWSSGVRKICGIPQDQFAEIFINIRAVADGPHENEPLHGIDPVNDLVPQKTIGTEA